MHRATGTDVCVCVWVGVWVCVGVGGCGCGYGCVPESVVDCGLNEGGGGEV